MDDKQLFNELSIYTLSLRDSVFIHQHIVDAFAAQHADEATKPITVAFALAGLYLHLEKGFSGREVQRAHMRLAKHKNRLPRFELPRERGEMTISDVMRFAPGADRNQAIERWSAYVWNAWQSSHATVAAWLKAELGIQLSSGDTTKGD